MHGLGTFINCLGVLGGGALGLCLRKGLAERYQSSLITVCGLSTLFLGIAGTLEEMLAIEGGVLASHKTMMILFSLALGAISGEALDIEKHIGEFGQWVKIRSGSGNDAYFVDGFVSASLTICIGAMAVVGSIEDGLNGDFSTLAAKAVLDLIIVLVLTIAWQRMHLCCDPPGTVSGEHHTSGRGHRASSHRRGGFQPVPGRLHADLLRGRESVV